MKSVEPLEPRRLLTSLTLDPSFDGDGVSFNKWSPDEWTDRAVAVAVDGSDRSVVVGNGGQSVVRYLASGQLDASFTPPWLSGSAVDDVLIQADGKVILAVKDSDRPLVRLNTDGSIDPTFASPDLSWALRGGISYEHRMVLTTDQQGRILLATGGGFTWGGNPNYQAIYVLRFTAEGSLDEYGQVPFNGNFGNWATDIQVDAAGNVYVLGNTNWYAYMGDYRSVDFNDSEQRWLLARLDDSLQPDTSFGPSGDGVLTPYYSGSSGKALVVTPEDGLLIAGWAMSSTPSAALWRVGTDGQVDTSFGGTGMVRTTNPSDATGSVFNDARLVNDRLFLVGISERWSYGQDSLLGVYNLDGTPDASFDGDGLRIDDLSKFRHDGLMGMAFDSQNRLLGAGYGDRSADGLNWMVARYSGLPNTNPPFAATVAVKMFNDLNGNLVNDAGEPGLAGKTLYLDPSPDLTYPDDRIAAVTDANGIAKWVVGFAGEFSINAPLVAGFKPSTYNGLRRRVAVDATGTTVTADPIGYRARAANTQLDASFGTGGSVSLSGPPSVVRAAGDGLVYVLISNSVLQRRLTSSGALDTTFGTNGQLSNLTNSTGAAGSIYDFLPLPDGSFIVASTSNSNLRIVHLLANGTRDASFGVNGFQTIDFGANEFSPDLTFGPNGTIVVAAGSQDPSNNYRTSTGVARLLANGALDTSFDGDGKAVYRPTSAANGEWYYTQRTLVAQADGKVLVVASQSGNGLTSTNVILRLNTNGALDTATFGGGDGIAAMPAGSGYVTINDLALDASGRIVFAGAARAPSTGAVQMTVGRLLGDGEFDASFGTAGMTSLSPTTNLGGLPYSSGNSIWVQDNGNLIVGGAGYVTTQSSVDVIVGRVLPNGARDTSFGSGGVAHAALADSSESAVAVFVDAAGRPIVAGSYSTENDSLGYLARFTAPVLASISGTLYNDLDNDGVKDGNEPGIAGRTVYLDTNNNGGFDPASEPSVITAADGSYRFGNLVAGNYNVRQVVPARWSQTSPPTNWTLTLTLAAGQQSANNHVGVRNTGGPAVVSSGFLFETVLGYSATFEESVAATLTADDISVVNLATNQPLAASLWSLAVNGIYTTVALQNTVPDGNYQVRIRANGVASSSGVFNATQITLPSFRVLAGDFNRDGKVNFEDLLTLAKNYNAGGKTFSQGNADRSADGKVTFADLLILAKNYNKTLPAPAAAFSQAAIDPTPTRRRSADSVVG